MRELGSRSSLYVDQSIKVEKELLKQVRCACVNLPSISACKHGISTCVYSSKPYDSIQLYQHVQPLTHAHTTDCAACNAQIETGQLSSESAIKALEAELAGAKKSLAGFEASFKADKASWGADLESARFEVRPAGCVFVLCPFDVLHASNVYPTL